MLSPEGIVKNIEWVFTRKLIMGMSYAGGPGKIALDQFSALNNALYSKRQCFPGGI